MHDIRCSGGRTLCDVLNGSRDEPVDAFYG